MRRLIGVVTIILIMLIAVLVGCGGTNDKATSTLRPADPVARYLEHKGYRVLSYEGTIHTYQLTKDKLVQLPYMLDWGLQGVDPTPYIGKTIKIEKYIVTNHPLDKFVLPGREAQAKALGKTQVNVFLVGNQPVGGTALPVMDDDVALTGGLWSLEGKTLEEVQPIKDFQSWRERWENRFK